MMHYYVKVGGTLKEVTRELFWVLRKRKGASESIMTSGGKKVGRYVRIDKE